jgi:hypothetical protein
VEHLGCDTIQGNNNRGIYEWTSLLQKLVQVERYEME